MSPQDARTICEPSIISRLFSAGVIRELARRGRSEQFCRLLQESKLLSCIDQSAKIQDVYERAFLLLTHQSYRDEYIYKAALTHKILLGIHNLNTATMLTELRVGKSKADVVIFNGTSTVYEIKSERDSLARLIGQLESYSRVFAKVNVIAGKKHIDEIIGIIPKHVGILQLSDRYQISIAREAEDNTSRICTEAIFDTVQLKEATAILKAAGIDVPNLPNTKMYSAVREKFLQLSPSQAHDGMVQILKNSRSCISLASFIEALPKSIQTAALTVSLRKQDQYRLLNVMEMPISEALKWR